MVYSHPNDEMLVTRSQDVEPIIERNKMLQNEGPDRRAFFRHHASVPLVVVEQWLSQGVNVFNKNDYPKVKKLLNSAEYKYLKTVTGKI